MQTIWRRGGAVCCVCNVLARRDFTYQIFLCTYHFVPDGSTGVKKSDPTGARGGSTPEMSIFYMMTYGYKNCS
jgi:hypothetical protein